MSYHSIFNVFNISSGALNIKDKGSLVSKDSYACAVTNLALSILCVVLCFPSCINMLKYKQEIVKSVLSIVPFQKKLGMYECLLLMMLATLNIGYSVTVMKYFEDNKPIDKMLFDFSASVIAIDAIAIPGTFLFFPKKL